MRTCLVLGAGASLANGQYFHGEKMLDQNPPLDTTFFEKIRALDITVDSSLRRYADALPTGSPFDRKTADGRMEDFFRDLFHDFLSEGDVRPELVQAYTALVALYRRVISATTDWMCPDHRTGAPVGKLMAAACDAGARVTVLTFNQDLVVENEIFKRARLRRHWCIEHAYGTFCNGREFTASSAPSFPRHVAACDDGDRLRVLKLHGSLNWYVRMNGRQPSPRVLAGQAGDRTVFVTTRRTVPAQFVFNRSGGGRGRTQWYTWPVIIPPVYAKQALIQAFLPAVWTDARRDLQDADRVVFFGYSLPPADIDAEKLFQRTLAANDRLAAIDVVDPEPGAAARYARLVPSKPLRWFPTLDSFLDANPFPRVATN
jgi:hypothetical protein